MKFSFRRRGSHSGENPNASRFSLPLSNRSFLGRSEGPPNQPKEPLLCLTLSTPSFLECSIIDAATTYPLYRIKTSSTTTTVMRRESVFSSVIASSIKWPKIIPMKRTKVRTELVLVNMRDGPWRGGNSLLKPGSRNNSRKFRLPGHDDPMKWVLHGDLYWCTTPSVVGAIATLDPRKGNRPPRLTVYEDLHDEYRPRQPVYGGVPILLLDYLVVTALLLVTDLQEWSLVPRPAYSRSDQAGLESAKPPMWKEGAMYPMANRLEAKSSSSMASTMRTGSLSRSPPTAQAGSSHSRNHQRPHSSVDTDSDPEDEYVSQWRRSLSPVSEAAPEASHPLHRPASPIQGSPVSSSPASDNLRKLLPEPTHDLGHFPCPPPLRNSIIPHDIDGSVFPSVLQMIHPLQRMELECEQNRYNHNTSQLPRTNSFRNPRPLPLLPIVHDPPVGLSRELSASLRSQHRVARILPTIPSQIAPGLHTRAVSEVRPTFRDDPPQNSQAICPREDVYQPITKASRITEWLNSLTGDSSTTENALELLLRASIFDSPPPAYNSLGFPFGQQRHERQPGAPEETSSECQR